MSRQGLQILAGVLGLVALIALGYTAWSENTKRAALQEDNDALLVSNVSFNAQITAYQEDIYNVLQSIETEELLQRVVTTTNLADRARLVSDLELDLLKYYVEYGAAVEIYGRLDELVKALTEAERTDIRDRFLVKVQDMRPFVEDQPFFEQAPDAKTVSTLITSLIAMGSALGSFVTFLMSGTERRVDDALAEVQLEKAKIELAQMRYDAREALDYMQGKPAEDPS